MKLKDLHYVMYGEEVGSQTPFGEDMPTVDELKVIFEGYATEFPNHNNFEFNCEHLHRRHGHISFQWELMGYEK